MLEEYFGNHFQLLSPDDLNAIHDATLEIMAEVGVRICGEEAQAILAAAGCHVDKHTDIVKFPAAPVEAAIDSAPAEFLMAARDPNHDAMQKVNKVTYTNFGTGIIIDDPFTGERRKTTKADLGLVARVCDAVPEVDQFTIAVTAQDVPEAVKELHEAEIVFQNTGKHFGHDVADGWTARKFIEMAALVAGGKERLRERPIACLGMCPNSPLEIHRGAAEVIIEGAKAGLPVDILSMAMTGGTSPVTIPGTLVVTNAEILAGITLAQLTHKGNPVIYGTSTTMMDMQHMTSPVGAPEHAMFGAAIAQMGLHYGIPTDCGGT